jgi:hypothetical protein
MSLSSSRLRKKVMVETHIYQPDRLPTNATALLIKKVTQLLIFMSQLKKKNLGGVKG